MPWSLGGGGSGFRLKTRKNSRPPDGADRYQILVESPAKLFYAD
jgi:hypothetical protein